MEIEKLKKEDFGSDQLVRGCPSIRFTKNGAIILNHNAVNLLKLSNGKEFHGVSICKDKKDPCDFAIMRDDKGWPLRSAGHGQAVFNNAALVRHVICKTFEKCPHAAGVPVPVNFTFRIATMPLDDDKNKDVFALLRKI